MSILDWKKEKELKRKAIKNIIGGEENMKFAKDYKDRYGIIKEMGEKCDKWKNIDYAVASGKILDAEVELEVECAFEQTRFDKPKKWYKNEDAQRIEELLLSKEEKKVQKTQERGETRTEINERLKAKYGFEINSTSFKKIEQKLNIEPTMVMPRHGGKKVSKYLNEDYDKVMKHITDVVIPRRLETKRAEVKVYNKYDDMYNYIQKKVDELKSRIVELENQVKERDQIIEDLKSKTMDNAFDKIKKMFGE